MCCHNINIQNFMLILRYMMAIKNSLKIHCVPVKTRHLTFDHSFGNCRPSKLRNSFTGRFILIVILIPLCYYQSCTKEEEITVRLNKRIRITGTIFGGI